MKKYFLQVNNDAYEIELDTSSGIHQNILHELPIEGVGNNIGGEIYFNLNVDIPFNGLEKEVFEKGDIIYWRSLEITKFAIAILYDNTNFGDGTKPRIYSPCIKFAKIKGDFSKLKTFRSGNSIKIISKES